MACYECDVLTKGLKPIQIQVHHSLNFRSVSVVKFYKKFRGKKNHSIKKGERIDLG